MRLNIFLNCIKFASIDRRGIIMASGNKLFGKRIKELREKMNYTQSKLAELVGIDIQSISRIETGYYFTTYENLEKIAKALNVSLNDLFNIGHMKPRKELIKELQEAINKSSDEDLKKIHKMVLGYLK